MATGQGRRHKNGREWGRPARPEEEGRSRRARRRGTFGHWVGLFGPVVVYQPPSWAPARRPRMRRRDTARSNWAQVIGPARRSESGGKETRGPPASVRRRRGRALPPPRRVVSLARLRPCHCRTILSLSLSLSSLHDWMHLQERTNE
jgi:hypothetical protein